MSISTVHRRDQVLEPIFGEDGSRLYDPTKIDGYRASIRQTTTTRSSDPHGIDGEVAADAFQAFEAGKGAVDVVCELRAHPDAVERLHTQWVRLRGRVVIERNVADAMRELLAEHVDIRSSDPNDIRDAIEALVNKLHEALTQLDGYRAKERTERARRAALQGDGASKRARVGNVVELPKPGGRSGDTGE